MCLMACQAEVCSHAQQRHGRTLVEHAWKSIRLFCGEGAKHHIQLCERVPGLPFLSVVQPEQCQRGSVGSCL